MKNDMLPEEVKKLQYLLNKKDREAAERRYAEDVFNRFVKETFLLSSEDFTQSLVSCLASLLQVRYTLISEITGSKKEKARTLAIYANGKFKDNFEYDLADTPCREVFYDKSLCFYPCNVQNLFPNDPILKQMGVESYVGIPLYSSDETVLGILIAMHDKSITHELRTKTLMEIFSVRASIELDRRKKEHELIKFKTVVKNSPAIVTITDHKGIIEYVNPRFTEITGFTSEELIGTSASDLGEQSSEDYNQMWATILAGKKWLGIFQNKKKDGSDYWEHATIASLKDEKGEIINFIKIAIDVSEYVRTEKTLRESEARLAEAQRIASLGNWDWDILNNNLWWSDEIYRIFGLMPNEFEANYEAFLKLIHPEDLEFIRNAVDQALYERKPYSIDHRIVLKDGRERIVHERAEVTFDDSGRPVRMIGTVQDVTDFKKTEHELKKFLTVIEQSVNLVFITDTEGVIEYVNPMFEEITGYSTDDAIGQKPSMLKSGETPREEYQILWDNIKSGKTWRGILKNRKKNGDYYWANNVVSPIKNEKGKIMQFLAIQEDITEKRNAEDRIKHLISYDTLTGLFNRTQFIQLLNCWIEEARTLNKKGALILIDLDHFRIINDIQGHARGDMVLNSVAAILENTIQEYYGSINKPNQLDRYITAHLDSDEFAAFLPECDEKGGLAAAEKIRTSLEDMRLLDLPARVTASIGVAVYPIHGETASDILKRADVAIYKAKDMGKNICRVFSPEDRDLEKIYHRLEWKERILNALEEDRFEPWFQPILDLKKEKICHYETLARMRDKEGSIISPAIFIEMAERFKITDLIDKLIIRKAMRLQAEKRSEGAEFNISINLSGRDLGSEEFLNFIQSQIAETGVDPAHLIFEITETEAVHNMDNAIKFIKAVKDIGCHFALDDFGVGFSSFLYLKMMLVDYIKIDGTFIRALHENPVDQLFVKSIANVARGMGVKTIAEFVETQESLDLLHEFGIDYAQGYLIGKPAPDYFAHR